MATTLPETETTQPSTNDLGSRFPGIVSADTRAAYKGWIVPKENLVEVATAIRDEFGYDMLATLTGVDFFPENRMEVVYHAYKTTGGPGLEFKVQVPREDPVEVPSLISIWPGVDFQEREAWDLFGYSVSLDSDTLDGDGLDGERRRIAFGDVAQIVRARRWITACVSAGRSRPTTSTTVWVFEAVLSISTCGLYCAMT